MGESAGHDPRGFDPARLRRLRWRARRGLLENDLILSRFFERYASRLTEQDIDGLDRLLDLSDNELLDLILARSEPSDPIAEPHARRVLEWLRAV